MTESIGSLHERTARRHVVGTRSFAAELPRLFLFTWHVALFVIRRRRLLENAGIVEACLRYISGSVCWFNRFITSVSHAETTTRHWLL